MYANCNHFRHSRELRCSENCSFRYQRKESQSDCLLGWCCPHWVKLFRKSKKICKYIALWPVKVSKSKFQGNHEVFHTYVSFSSKKGTSTSYVTWNRQSAVSCDSFFWSSGLHVLNFLSTRKMSFTPRFWLAAWGITVLSTAILILLLLYWRAHCSSYILRPSKTYRRSEIGLCTRNFDVNEWSGRDKWRIRAWEWRSAHATVRWFLERRTHYRLC